VQESVGEHYLQKKEAHLAGFRQDEFHIGHGYKVANSSSAAQHQYHFHPLILATTSFPSPLPLHKQRSADWLNDISCMARYLQRIA